MQKFVGVLIGLLLIGGIIFIVLPRFQKVTSPTKDAPTSHVIPSETPSSNKTSTDSTARFTIYTQGTERIFTDSKYHNRSNDIFIEASDPTKVVIVNPTITWQEFFDTLPSPMKVTKDCLTTGTDQLYCSNDAYSLNFYINGIADEDALEKGIIKGDTLLVSYGENTAREIKNQMKSLTTPKQIQQ